jgi:hypothetical protein
MILTIDLINHEALNLLQDMERLNLIRVTPSVKASSVQGGKLSNRFAGALHLSDEGYAAYQNTLQKGRVEWERDIY